MADPTPTSVTPPLPQPPLNYGSTNPTSTSVSSITPSNPQGASTVIPTSTLTGTSKLNLPASQPSSGVAPAQAIIGSSQGIFAGQANLTNGTQSDVNSAQSTFNQQQGGVQDLIGQYLGKGQDQLAQEQAAGVNGLRSASNSLTNQYLTMQGAYNAQYNAILNRSGGTAEQKAQEISDLQQQHGYNLASVAMQQSIASTDYTNAENIIQHNIDIKYAPLKDAIGYQMQLLNNDKDFLTTKQTQNFQANLAVQAQNYDMGKYYSQLAATTGMDMVKSAAAQNADPATLQAMGQVIAKGGSPADVAAASNGYLIDGNFTQGYNPVTQKMGMYNQKTGIWKDGSTTTPTMTIDATDPNSINTVKASDGSGYNFATSGYNTADSSYGVKLNGLVQKIQTQYGPVTDAKTADSVLKNLAPTSNLTGQMIINAAQGAGIDPTVFMAQLQQESLLGTSNVAVNNNNCGGIKYVGQANAEKGTPCPPSEGGYYAKFKTPQDGLNAEAALVAKAKVPPTQNTTGQTQQTQYNLQTISTLKSALPQNISAGISYLTQTGDGYIDMDKVTDLPGIPDMLKGQARNQALQYAKQYGLTPLSGNQAAAMQDADSALTQINNIQSAWNAVAPQSGYEATTGGFGNNLALLMHSGNSSALKTYMSLAPTAVSTLNSITGSKRLSQFTESLSNDSLPGLPGTTFGILPSTKGDTLTEGNAKLDNLRRDINASITPIITKSKGAPLSSEFVNIKTPDGRTGQIPSANLQAALKAGASQI